MSKHTSNQQYSSYVIKTFKTFQIKSATIIEHLKWFKVNTHSIRWQHYGAKTTADGSTNMFDSLNVWPWVVAVAYAWSGPENAFRWEEEFICHVNKQYNYAKIEIHWQVVRKGINPSMLVTYHLYGFLSKFLLSDLNREIYWDTSRDIHISIILY